MGKRLVLGAMALCLGWAGMAVAEGDLARRAPPARPVDLIEISAAQSEQPAPVAPGAATPEAAVETAATAPEEPPRDPNRGIVTNLPIPRFVTLKTNEGNARRGPGLTHRIDWVFTRAGMPLRVTAEFENWRRVEDQEGVGGWVHYTLLSGSRSALVIAELADFRDDPDDAARAAFQAEAGVVGRLLECSADWCRMSVDGSRAWVRKSALWGVVPGEVVE
ncbi:MAG: SH3 domain-containing protein [Paracoccaceae bacterium]